MQKERRNKEYFHHHHHNNNLNSSQWNYRKNNFSQEGFDRHLRYTCAKVCPHRERRGLRKGSGEGERERETEWYKVEGNKELRTKNVC